MALPQPRPNQIEIRTIRADEAGQFLRLLCDVFALDFDRASKVFFVDPTFDLSRKWALFEGGRMVSILTTASVEFGWGKGIGIAGVATLETDRGRGLASELLDRVLESAEQENEAPAMLFAHDVTLYARHGFEVVDEVIRGKCITDRTDWRPAAPLDQGVVEERYARWSSEDPARMLRNELRWKVWKMGFRIANAIGDGYVTHEGSLVREAVGVVGDEWKLPPDTEWIGLKSMTDLLEVPIGPPERELIVMARNFPVAPQMFMTDQF